MPLFWFRIVITVGNSLIYETPSPQGLLRPMEYLYTYVIFFEIKLYGLMVNSVVLNRSALNGGTEVSTNSRVELYV